MNITSTSQQPSLVQARDRSGLGIVLVQCSKELEFSISLLPHGRLEPAGVECLPFPCHFCSAKSPAGSALVKSFLPGAEVAKKIGMCLVFQHGFSSLFARSTGECWGGQFSDNHHEKLSELQDAKFTGVWEPQESCVPGVFISQACPCRACCILSTQHRCVQSWQCD